MQEVRRAFRAQDAVGARRSRRIEPHGGDLRDRHACSQGRDLQAGRNLPQADVGTVRRQGRVLAQSIDEERPPSAIEQRHIDGCAAEVNPVVVRGVIYGRGPNNSFVAVDAATGKELWVHKDVQGFNTRGINYWESADGKDRRLIFSANNILQELDAQTGEKMAAFGVN